MKPTRALPVLISGLVALITNLSCVNTFGQKPATDFGNMNGTLFKVNTFGQKPGTDFTDMKGTLFTYKITDKDSLSAKEIIELRDEKGLPVWFSRDFFKQVCITGECRMVHLRIYWTGAANYLGLQLFEPLEKTGNILFKPEDYQKLDRILSDSLSVLKGLKIEDLTVGENKDSVDAKSGATQPLIVEYVVRNAVYTCYTLWHTVYGSTRERIKSILGQRADSDYLRLVFNSKDPQQLSWAIDFIGRHPEYHQSFYSEIMNLIKMGDLNLSQKAADYFTPARLSGADIQKELAMTMGEGSSQSKYEIISIFSALQQVNDDAILILLKQFENQKINAGLLGSVCKMIRPENMKNVRIVKKLESISKNKNPYVRNMTQKLLYPVL